MTLSKRLVERGHEIAVLLREGLARLCLEDPKIREVRGRGLMIALEFHDEDTATSTRRLFRELLAVDRWWRSGRACP